MLHFGYLADPDDGPLVVAGTLAEHAEHVAEGLGSNGATALQSPQTMEPFVWPHGRGGPVSRAVVDAVEDLSRRHERSGKRSWRPVRRVTGRTLALGGREVLRRRVRHTRLEKRRANEDLSQDVVAKAAAAEAVKATKAPEKATNAPKKAPKGAKEKAPKAKKERAPKGAKQEAPKTKIAKASSGEAATGPLAPELELLRAEVGRLADRGNPIIVGPFMAEVGFELLYWIPLVRWAVAKFPALQGRLTVVSRGGTGDWLQGVECDYVDLLSMYEPEELVRRRVSLKQRELNEFEFEIFRQVKAQRGLERSDVFHPSLFFNTYYRVMKMDRRGFITSVVHDENESTGLAARYARLTAPDAGSVADRLPEDYVAVRFYARPSFPDSAENRAFMSATIEALCATGPVVVLNNRLELDDHFDLEPAAHQNVVMIDDLMEPSNNLQVQTIAVSRARGFVGTYGGLAYLAPFFGVPSIGFRSVEGELHAWHHELALRIFEGPGWGELTWTRPTETSPEEIVAKLAPPQAPVGATTPREASND
jgi:hypothetical protein